jgi:hypothetical protein
MLTLHDRALPSSGLPLCHQPRERSQLGQRDARDQGDSRVRGQSGGVGRLSGSLAVIPLHRRSSRIPLVDSGPRSSSGSEIQRRQGRRVTQSEPTHGCMSRRLTRSNVPPEV